MIITIKGANFSTNKIGTLSTYSIEFRGSGVLNEDTSVDRESNTGYTTTITLDTDYELNGSITVNMGGTDITSTAVSGLTITIPTKVTGNVVITVPAVNTNTGEEDSGGTNTPVNPPSGGTVRATTHSNARAIPAGSTSTTNLFDTIGYMGVIWNNTQNKYVTPSDITDSLSIPVVPGDRIVWTAVKQSGTNGGTSNGIRYTLFSGDTKVSSIAPADAYAEYSSNGYITIPDGVDCINVPVWDDRYANECFLLTLSAEDTSYIGIAPVVGTRATTNSHANVQTMPSTITSTTNLIGTIPQTDDYYYLASGWGAAAGLACITFPVLPGDKISGNVLGTKTENGSTVDGTRVTYLSGDTIVASTPPTTIYNEYKANGHITVPAGCDCMCIPFNPSAISTNNLNVYILTI